MSDYRFLPVEQPLTASVKAQVLALWKSGDAVIDNPDERLSQVAYAAHSPDGTLAGVCSYQLQRGLYSALSVYGLRVFVAPNHRQGLLAFELLAHLGESLIDAHRPPAQTQTAGLCAVIETEIVNDRGAEFVERTFQFAVNKHPVTFVMTGFSPGGSPEYTHYFNLPAPPLLDARANSYTVTQLHEKSDESLRKAVAKILINQKKLKLDQLDAYVSQKLVLAISDSNTLDAVCLLVPRYVRELNATLFGLVLLARDPATLTSDKQNLLITIIYEHMNSLFDGDINASIGVFTLHPSRTELPLLDEDSGLRFHGIDNQGQEMRLRFFEGAKVIVPQRAAQH